VYYDKVPETNKLFSLRYFALFSLFGSIWKHLEADCFRYFAHCFHYLEAFGSIWKLTVFAILHRFRYLEAFGS